MRKVSGEAVTVTPYAEPRYCMVPTVSQRQVAVPAARRGLPVIQAVPLLLEKCSVTDRPSRTARFRA